MSILNIKKMALLFALAMVTNHLIAQTTDSVANIKKADKWVKSNAWAKDLKIKLHTPVNSVEFKKQYELNKTIWDKVFTFLDDSKLSTLAPGKYPIEGTGLFASITEAPSKKFEDTKWESHRKVIDLQYIIIGKEKMGKAPVSTATVTQAYNSTKDVANYTTEGTYAIATPMEFFLFFPDDAHRPSIIVDGYDTVKKLVIKIPYMQ
ncbi:MAG: hypothetical protein JWQ06_530 [Mucilaginibacter sp.]|nr:hypothetical protein [Mucilaginibacter sp.]